MLLLSVTSARLSTSHAQGTAFTYQGRLNDGANPANGRYDFRFKLYNDPYGSFQVGASYLTNSVPAGNGLFTTTIDFGAGIFIGGTNWLEVGVRTNGGSGYTVLSPLQTLTPTPSAIFAETASNLTGVLPAAQLGGILSNSSLPASPNFSGAVSATSYTGNGANLTNVNAATLGGLDATTFWNLGGNNVSGGQFFGSTNNQAVEIRVNGQRALLLMTNSSDSPNIVGGSPVNMIDAGVRGAVIAGGGATIFLGNPSSNQISADFSSIGGGSGNRIQFGADHSVIVNGRQNLIMSNAWQSVIAGGQNNSISNAYSFIGGGSDNIAGGEHSSAGGYYTIASGQYSVAMGHNSKADGHHSTAIGFNTTASGPYSTSMGNNTTASGPYSTAMGNNTTASGPFSTATGDASSSTNSWTLVAGRRAKAYHQGAFVWADSQNADFASTLSDQFLIRAQGGVGIGKNNPATALDVNGTVTANGFAGSGAALTSLSAGNLSSGTVPSGVLSGTYSSAVTLNNAGNSFTGSGASLTSLNAANISSGTLADARLSANVALLAGAQTFTGAKTFSSELAATGGVRINNTNVWFKGDNQHGLGWYGSGRPFAGISTIDGPVLFGFSGGALATEQFGTEHLAVQWTPTTVTVTGTFNNNSDRNAKEHFVAISSAEILAKVSQLPLAAWSYKTDADTRHIGPMAQDFYSAFNVGTDDKHIAPIDEGGVALAAIQGLNEKVEVGNQKAEGRIQKLESENEQLKRELFEIKLLLAKLSTHQN